MSHTLFKDKVVPELSDKQPTLLIVIDNLRYDQWKAFEPIVNNYYKKASELSFYSILPTATGKNMHEGDFLREQLKRLGLGNIKHEYHKITNLKAGKKLVENFRSLKDNDLNVVVYNFVDMLSHSKTEMEVVKELASNDKAYRSLTVSWFKNSPLLEMIQLSQQLGFKLILTTDHGTINVKAPSKVIGDRDTSLNLRYKTGRSLTYQDKDVLAVKNPKSVHLPSMSMSSSFIFAKGDMFLAYPNNFNL